MRILFDQGTPVPLRRELAGHDVKTAHELGWHDLSNGDLLLQAESGFDLLITTDQNLRFQQNLTDRRLAILVRPTTSWPLIRQRAQEIVAAISTMQAGDYCQLKFAQ